MKRLWIYRGKKRGWELRDWEKDETLFTARKTPLRFWEDEQEQEHAKQITSTS